MRIEGDSTEFDLKDEKFWSDIDNYLRFGIPAHDKRGHSAEVRFRVRPVQLDIVGRIREQLPENLFKSNAALYRSLLVVGCKCALESLKRRGEATDDIGVLIEGLNRLSREIRLGELEKDIEHAQQGILRSDIQDKSNVIELLDKMKQDVRKRKVSS